MFLRENEEGSRIAPHLRAGQTMLDLGAGTGFMSRWLARRTGVRPTLCDLVEYRNRDRSLPFIAQTDPFHVPVPDGSFDVVLMMFVLHHVTSYDDQPRVIDEARRIARERVIVTEDTPATALDRAFNAAWDRLLNVRHGVPTPCTFRSARAWEEAFAGRGLRLVHRETYRPMWPTLKTYPHTLFVLEPRDAA
ncbi:MAG TPA: class I SAM-dependent methyltransferase [Actinomycetota bacterium]|nr:class I SAM-dependent methyltransferase [Actinomycetota bacterium]